MVKKCVAVGDIFITPEMMKAGIEKGYEDIEKGNVVNAVEAFTKFRETH